MKHTGWTSLIAGAAGAMWLAGCVTTPPRVVAQPAPAPARPVVVVAAPPPPPPVVVRPAVQEQIVTEPNDVYISAALDTDIVFVGGSTYIWAVGPDGHRHRHLYGRGDRRQEIFRRRDNLHSVNAHRGGPPPMHYSVREQNNRLEAIRRDQLHREEQARLARAHAHDPHWDHGRGQARGPNGPSDHGHIDARAVDHRHDRPQDPRAAANAPRQHADVHGDPHRGAAPSQGRTIHEASADRPGQPHRSMDGSSPQ